MKSIQARFVLLMIAIVSSLLGIFGAISYADSKAEKRAQLDSHLRAIEHRLSQSLPALVWRFDRAQIRQTVDAELGSAAIVGIAVYDENQRLLYSAPAQAAFAQQQTAVPVLTEEGQFLHSFGLSLRDSDGLQALGSVHVLATSQGIAQSLHKELRRLVALILLMNLAIVAALCAVMRWVIMRPLMGLRDGLQAMASQGADLRLRLPRSQWTEFAQVTDGFNAFAGQLEVALGASVDDVHQTISRIAQGDFSQPVAKAAGAQGQGNTVMAHLGVMQEALIALTAQLRRAKQAADAASQAKSDFLANMSHEIRTPLNAILGMTRLAMHAGLPAAQQLQLSKVMHSAQHLLALINDILDFSKIEAGKLSLEHVRFELTDVLDNISTLLGDRAADQGLEFVMDIAPDVPWQLQGDPLRLSQIMVNFVSNAVKFTPQGQVVLYMRCVAREGRSVRLRMGVRDTGIGIAQSKQGELFNSFMQTDSSNSRQYGGTGLGLAIARRLAELMQGEVGVQSRPGEGSDFWCEVVLSAHSQAGPALAALRPPSVRHALLVGALPSTAQQLEQLLQQAGLRITHATDWSEADALLLAAQAQDTPVDWLFVDQRVSGAEGEAVTQRLQALSLLRLPRLFWMPQGSAQTAAFNARQHGYADVLVKPFHAASLALLLQRQGMQVRPALTPLPVESTRRGLTTQALRASAGARVLVVEDIEINREVAAGLLHELGIGLQVDFAHDGAQALQCLAQQPYQAVFMDMHMPVMDGLTAAKAIRAQPAWSHIPIIAMTANHQPQDIERCMQAGMCDFVSKPIDPDALRRAVQRWVVADRQQGDQAQAQPMAASASPSGADVPPKLPQLLVWLQNVSGLDAPAGLQRFHGRQATYREMLRRFVVDSVQQDRALLAAWQAQDWVQLQSLAQALRREATDLGAFNVAQQAQRLDDAAQAMVEVPQLSVHLERLRSSMADLAGAIQRALPQVFVQG